MSAQEALAVALAIAYLVLAIRENRFCWPAGIGSSLLYLGVFYDAGLYMQSALQLFYVAMGGYGWWVWRPDSREPLTIHRWPWRWHAVAITVIALLSASSGWLLAHYSAATSPYLDSFVTWSAVLTTWMVARKLLENWLYWFVIDGVSLALALRSGLHLTAGLFTLYLVLVVIGWRAWFANWRRLA